MNDRSTAIMPIRIIVLVPVGSAARAAENNDDPNGAALAGNRHRVIVSGGS